MADDVLVVIGGSRGIGAAVARLGASRGYTVVLTYVSRAEEAEKLAVDIRTGGGRALAVQADAGSEADLVALFDKAASIGAIAGMVYSTGITGAASPLADVEAQTLREVININLVGAMLSAREAVRRMMPENGGRGGSIVFISSRAAGLGSAGEYVWYAASKGGMDSFSIGLSKEVAGDGIRVNCVSPGPVATDMLSPERQALGASRVPMQRVGSPEEVAACVLYLLSDEASFVTGANLAVSGGA